MGNGKITYRMFGSSDCPTCKKMRKAMDFYGFYYEFIDADDDSNEELCSKFGVETYPHLQALSEETGEVYVQYIGYISPIAFFNLLCEKMNYDDPNLTIRGVSQVYGTSSKGSTGCGCGKKNTETEAQRSARKGSEP
tara:strand:+ start:41480 stop:41890 length:411 start_codon:yes stop_codon:yes gene_type:complete